MATSVYFNFDNGDLVKDKITGLCGIIVARYHYATDCKQYGVCSEDLDEKGKPKDWEQFDEGRLELVEPNYVCLSAPDNGGPQPKAQQM